MEILVAAEYHVRAMNLKQKEALVDELHRVQPHVLASFLVQQRLGVSITKMEFLIELMLICFQAMKDSGFRWPLITEDEQERQLARLVGTIGLGTDLAKDMRAEANRDYFSKHPEKVLFAYVQHEVDCWLKGVPPEESDKYVAMAAMNFVNCIAFSEATPADLAGRG